MSSTLDAAVVVDAPDQLGEVALLRRVGAGRRLVEQQHTGVGAERPGDLEPALLAVGEGAGELVGPRARRTSRSSSSACAGALALLAALPRHPEHRRDRTGPLPRLDPDLDVLEAVSAGNSRMFWKVRATPRWLITWVFLPSTLTIGSPGRPEASMRPSWGGYTPVSELNSEVLPAPLGPMTARISPRCIDIVTSLRLTTPPKRKRDVLDVEDQVGRCVRGRRHGTSHPLARGHGPHLGAGRARRGRAARRLDAGPGSDRPAGRSSWPARSRRSTSAGLPAAPAPSGTAAAR